MKSVLMRSAIVATFVVAGAGLALAQSEPAKTSPEPAAKTGADTAAKTSPDNPAEKTATSPTPSQAGADPTMAKTPGSDAQPGVAPKVQDPESTAKLAPTEQPTNNANPRIAGQKVPSAEHDTGAHNKSVAEHDKQPTITHTFNFTAEQKQVIMAALASEKPAPTPVTDLQEATVVPGSVELKPVPDSVSKQMPWVAPYKYVKFGSKIALVEPNLKYVAIILQ